MQSNDSFRSSSPNPAERRSVEDSVAKSILWGFTVAAEGNDNKDLSKQNVDTISPDDSTPVTRDVTNACLIVPVELPGVVGVTADGNLRQKAYYSSYGISTAAQTQHSERHISDRGEPFGIPGEFVDGNDPVATWHALERAFDYCRTTRRPFLLEAAVSRLHGHSSSSGAARIQNEPDCVKLFERRFIQDGIIHRELAEAIWHEAHEEADQAVVQAMEDAKPSPDDVERFTYAPSPVDAVYPDDYNGLPR